MSSLLIHNARLLSFHQGFNPGVADALAIEGDKIIAVDRKENLQSLITPQTRLMDAQGLTVMPGLHDSHIHIWKVGSLMISMLDLRGASSLDHFLTLIREYGQQHPEAAWITARGFNEAAWKDGRIPTKQDLDRLALDKPAYIIRTCAHIAVCNSAALRIAGIDALTKDPEGGVIYRDASGQPNGILSETALGLVTAHIPSYTKDELKSMVRRATTEFHRYGITAATDPAVDPTLLEAYYEMQQADELGFRLQAIPILLPDGGIKPYPPPEKYLSPYMTVNTVKFFSDGGLSGKTAALKRGYKPDHANDAPEYGVLRLEKHRYEELCLASLEKGLGIATHAIGDTAIGFVTDAYTRLRSAFPSSRLRIEHLGLPEEQHLLRMAEQKIAVSMQTIFISELGKNFIKYLDDPYLLRCYPVRSVLRHGILTALSSDAPVVSNFNPFKGMEAAVTRQTNEGVSIAPAESISITEALQAYTSSAAEISDTPGLGSLKPGNYADLIFLDKDPLKVAPEKIATIQVQKTLVAGQLVWNRENAG